MQIDFKKPKKIYANQELHHRLDTWDGSTVTVPM